MTDTLASPPTLLRHAVFLTRGADAESSAPAVRLGQGAFLTLRLVDLLRSEPPTGGDVFHYQWSATERYCRELAIDSPETSHLLAVVQSARDAFTDARTGPVSPALFAYAHFLEEESQYEEALDVLATLEMVAGSALSNAEAIATTLRIARVNRKLAKFEEAEAAYELAGRRAQQVGDTYSTLLGRIGRANIVYDRGNLADAEQLYTAVAVDAHAAGQTDAEARAEHGLGATLDLRRQSADAIPHVWRAFELYDDASSRARALNDLGIMWRTIGDLSAAERAFQAVRQSRVSLDHSIYAIVELMECASARRDRVSYHRFRDEARRHETKMAPRVQVDFHLKQGVAESRFGNIDRAREEMLQALDLAHGARLHEFVFRIEGVLRELRDAELPLVTVALNVAEPPQNAALDAVRASLHELAEV